MGWKKTKFLEGLINSVFKKNTWEKLCGKLYVLRITADRLDLQNKDRVNCNQKQYASPGGQPRNGVLYRRGKKKKQTGYSVTHTWEVSPRKRCGERENHPKTLTWVYKIEIGERGVRHKCEGLESQIWKSFILGLSKRSPRISPIFSLLPKHRVQSLNNNLKAISFSKGQILAIFCSLVSKEKGLSFQTSGITYLEKPPVHSSCKRLSFEFYFWNKTHVPSNISCNNHH